MRPRKHRGFTLIELLIVIAIIGVLATLLLTAISSARRKSQIAVAKSHINAIKAALAAYETDMGRFPRLSSSSATTSFPDESLCLYVALRNQPGRGGGPNSPYLQDWKLDDIGLFPRARVTNGSVTDNEAGWGCNAQDLPEVEKLTTADSEEINDLSYQEAHQPLGGSADPLVLLDPWGMPFHYREWSSVRKSVKNGNLGTKTVTGYQGQNTSPGQPVVDGDMQQRAREPEGFDIWSNGPNRVNEFGHPDSDDVCSWR